MCNDYMNCIDTTKPKGSDTTDYNNELEKRGIKKNRLARYLNTPTRFIAQQNFSYMVVAALVFGIIISIFPSCMVPTTRDSVYVESSVPGKIEDNGDIVYEKKMEIKKIERNHLNNSYFNLDIFIDVFKGWLILSAFILGFARWQVSNRQSAMSEIFERKRESNLQILTHKENIKDLISGALTFNLEQDNKETGNQNPDNKKRRFKEEEKDLLVDHFKTKNPHGKKETCFVQRMFVYMELDNLEFAHMKYMSGYLDAEQMYRACEIFESRCKSDLFRHIAAEQGLKYYTTEFHTLLETLLIFGFSYSKENIYNEDDAITREKLE